ncbi:GIN domain-containing protein [Mangrovimonas spongiae]|uniref:Putative auto-transporter adhesin head GIN domain-containing protein n=1 Tax=Mangrovimonas spongiae TaxID=2494697 RepID=A0A428JY91_9FLAO|nr:DUF2807 domain-containing protein [Mangrovimonas spongiae]RSK39119.1 hypothetical protein EJA19_09255 [Mangrovimonas spongiae]
MKKCLFLTGIFAILTLSVFAQEKIKGNRNVTIVETKIDPFNKLVVSQDFQVVLVKGFDASVEIEADENLHDIINFDVSNGVLSLSTDYKIRSKRKLNITIKYTEDLSFIQLKNAAKISAISTFGNPEITLELHDDSNTELNIESKKLNIIAQAKSKLKLNIQSDSVHLELNESSKMEALINGQYLKADLYQSAKANIEGTCAKLDLNTMNFSDFTGKNFTCKNSTILAEDSSDVAIHTEEHLILEATGDSEIELYGLPKITINTFSGTTELKKKEL